MASIRRRWLGGFNEIEKRGHSPEETEVGYKLKTVIFLVNKMKEKK